MLNQLDPIEQFHVTSSEIVSRPVGVQVKDCKMVLCIMTGCLKRSDRDKDVYFFGIPSVLTCLGKKDYELSKRQRDVFLAATSREDLTESILRNGRVSSRHFVLGKPTDLYDEAKPDWLITFKLGWIEEQCKWRGNYRKM